MDAEILHILAGAGIALDDNGDPHGQEQGRRLGEPQRYPFTPDDDERLQEWVARAEAQGVRIKPKIFADLERTSPRYTAGSWRARWRKIRDGRHDMAGEGGLPEGQRLQMEAGQSTPLAAPEQMDAGKEQSTPLAAPEQMDTGKEQSTPLASPQEQPDTGAVPDLKQNQTPENPCKQQHCELQTQTPPLCKRQDREPTQTPPLCKRPRQFQTPLPQVTPPVSALAPVPGYAPARSRTEPGQIRAWEWMAASGRRRFLAHEELLLSRWGVKPSHQGTCVPVPQIWATIDPAALLTTFDHTAYAHLSETRLSFSMRDHAAPWARAAAWFRSAPHSGVEFDNFISCGPFQPMEGSHLCHQAFCINPNHLVYEAVWLNTDRKRCHAVAHTLRQNGLAVPACCTEHRPPCLLQHAALTPYEAILIQLAVVAEARGRLPPEQCSSADHPYRTFESRLPLSFPGCAVVLDRTHLATSLAGGAGVERLTFRCRFCIPARPFLSLQRFWGHIRDRHRLVPCSTRLEDVIRSGGEWLEGAAQQGSTQEGALGRLARRTQEPGFTWGVLSGWKLGPSRKRAWEELEGQ